MEAHLVNKIHIKYSYQKFYSSPYENAIVKIY